MYPSENLHTNRILAVMAALAVLAIGTGAVVAQENDGNFLNQAPIAGPNRPANVPQDYVLTPFGYFHPSCVQKIAAGETLLADGRVKHQDGTAPANVPVCRYARYDRHGVPMTSAAPAQIGPEASGWIENANVATGSPTEWYSGLVAIWVVPPQPRANNGQVLFYFPGLEDINNTLSILQPVLQWAGGQWAVAIRIVGTIAGDCRPEKVPCASWTVFSFDADSGESTTLKHTPSDGQIFNWAFGGVMEPYYVVSCDDYPADNSLTFDVLLFNKQLKPIRNPGWNKGFNSTVTPQCNYGVNASNYEVELDY